MVHRSYITIAIIVFLTSVSFLSIAIPSCDANYVNWGMLEEGSSFHNGTHIRMPYADVRSNITRGASAVYISLDSEFHIMTNITQNATLAFVQPAIVREDLLYDIPPTNGNEEFANESSFMRIYANGSIVNFTTSHYDNLTEAGFIEEFPFGYGNFMTNSEFALFNLELTANTTLVLSTVSGAIFHVNMERFDYSYIVGSARTFEGHTMERVHMRVVEEVPLLSKNFSPNESLTVISENTITDATWDLNVTEFSQDMVHFSAMVWDPSIERVSTIAISLSVIVAVVLVYQFGYKRWKVT
ncbi:hypothetical protein EU528_14180 [Candidatus Thorarchaeota archaeon]|nr:MAG: hypothetical protein EU528_14180 [Candidatus Thorarchaeota archaeon]